MKYISPTSLAMFEKDREEFYLKYVAENKPPKLEQTKPMAIGSAFDTYIKTFLESKLNGRKGLFDSLWQVEIPDQNWAKEHGKYVFGCYIASGALADLMLELSLASSIVKMESSIELCVTINGTQIPIMGKPDIYFECPDFLYINDWKVNGYCGSSNISPKPGYVNCGGKAHKNAVLGDVMGIRYNKAGGMDTSWLTQLTIYAMCIWGIKYPSKPILVGIDQLCCSGTTPNATNTLPSRDDTLPTIRVAQHRQFIPVPFWEDVLSRIYTCWTAVQNGTVVSPSRAQELEEYYKAYQQKGMDNEWLEKITRQHSNF